VINLIVFIWMNIFWWLLCRDMARSGIKGGKYEPETEKISRPARKDAA